MKIALLGYGTMGHEVEKIAQQRGHEIVLKIGRQNKDEILKAKELGADVAIDFSLPEIAPELIKHCLEQDIKVVSGTTGWLESMQEIEETCSSRKGAFLYASNFSIGVNLFFNLSEKLAQLMLPHADYQASMKETHHTRKKDAPSGTAISLADIIIQEDSRYSSWKLSTENGQAEALSIEAERTDDVPGTHEIFYKSEIDTISIKHEAHNRKGFALGAVIAAEWIKDKTGLFNMNDVLDL